MRRLLSLIVAAGASVILPRTCPAVFTIWTGAAGNSLWSDPVNWSNGVPGINDWASIGTIDTPIQLGGDRSVSFLRLRGTVELVGGEISPQSIQTLDFGLDTSATLRANVSARPPYLSTSSFFGTITIDGTLKGNGATIRTTGKTILAGPVLYDATFHGANFVLANAGTMLDVTSIELDGGVFTLDNSTQAVSGRLNPSVVLSNRNDTSFGTFAINGNETTDVSERLDRVEADVNGIAVILTTPGANVKLHIGSLGVAPTLFFQAQANGKTTRITTPTIPQQIGGAVGVELPVVRNAYAVSRNAVGTTNPAGFLTFDTALHPDGSLVGFRSLRDDEYFNGVAGAPALANVRIASDVANTAPTNVNSLRIDGPGSLTLDSDLTLASGMIVHTQSQTSSSAAVIAGSGKLRSTLPMQLAASSTSTQAMLNISASIDAPSLLLGGTGSVRLSGDNTLPQGITIVEKATLTVGKPQGLGTGKLTLVSGSLGFEGDTTINNPIHLEQGHYSASEFSVHGSSIGLPEGKTLTVNGPVTGGGILFQSNGYLRLNGGGSFFGYLGSSNLGLQPAIEVNGIWNDVGPLNSYAQLYGNATIPVTIESGIVSPGPIDEIGTMHIKGFGSNGSVRIDIYGAACDLLLVDTVTAPVGLRPYAGTALEMGRTYRVIDVVDPALRYTTIGGAAEGSVISSIYGGAHFRISYVGGDGNDVTLTVVPEPSTLAVLVLSSALIHRRRARG